MGPTLRFFLLKRIALALGAMVVTLAGLELLLRTFHAQPYITQPFLHLKFHQYDPQIGITLTPHQRGRLRTSEGDRHYDVAINSIGCRGGPLPSTRDLIGVLGDSFIFGYGVDQSRTCTEQLNQRFGGKVINMGISGTGTDQHYLWLKRQLMGLSFQTVVLFISNNDFENVMQQIRYSLGAPLLVPTNGGFKFSTPPKTPLLKKYTYSPEYNRLLVNGKLKKWPFWRRFFLFHVARSQRLPLLNPLQERQQHEFWVSYNRQLFDQDFPEMLQVAATPAPKASDQLNPRFQRMGWLLQKFRQLSQDQGFGLIVMFDCLALEEQNFLRHSFCSTGRCISLCDYFERFQNRHPGIDLYFRRNPHWNDMGHKLVAHVLAQYLGHSEHTKDSP